MKAQTVPACRDAFLHACADKNIDSATLAMGNFVNTLHDMTGSTISDAFAEALLHIGYASLYLKETPYDDYFLLRNDQPWLEIPVKPEKLRMVLNCHQMKGNMSIAQQAYINVAKTKKLIT